MPEIIYDKKATGHFIRINDDFENALVEALRYTYGRYTITTGDTAMWMSSMELLRLFSDKTLYVIWRDIEDFKERRECFAPSAIEIYENDVLPFLELQEMVTVVLEERGYVPHVSRGLQHITGGSTSDNLESDNKSDKGAN